MKSNKMITITYIKKPFDDNTIGMIPAIDIENEDKIIEEIREILSNLKYSGGKIELYINNYEEINETK